MYLTRKKHTASKKPVLKTILPTQLLKGLMVTVCACLLVNEAEAAKPKVVVAKIASPNEGAAVSLDGSKSSDRDGDNLTYTWTQTKGLSVSIANANTATATFTAPAIVKTKKATKPVNLTFQLAVNDGKYTVKKAVVVTVKPVNALPNAVAGNDRTVKWDAVKSGITLDASGSNDDGNIVKYQWILLTKKAALPKGAKFTLKNAKAEKATFVFSSPVETNPVSLDFELAVTDNDNKKAKDTLKITVSNTLPATAANAGSDQTVLAGAVVTLNGGQSTNADTYNWQQTAGSTVSLSSTDKATTSFTAPAVTVSTAFTFELTTTNNSSGSSKDSVTITVNPVTPQPSADLNAELSVSQGEVFIDDMASAVIKNITGGTAPYSVTYDWGNGKTTGPITLAAGVLSNNGEHLYDAENTYDVKVTVTDANKLSKTFTSKITVTSIEQCK